MTTLYKLGGLGLVVWAIQRNNNQLLIQHGRVGGKQQEDSLALPSPEDAKREFAHRIDVKKTKQGYTSTIPTKVPNLPMLAQRFDKHGHKLPDEVYVQPKLNGLRGIMSKGKLLSRRNTPYWSLPHLTALSRKLPEGVVLDGELYCHGMSFQEHCSLIKRETFHKNYNRISYHVFDVQTSDPFDDRLSYYRELVKELASKYIVSVLTTSITTQRAKDFLDNNFLDYEGIILRDPEASYHYNKRSDALQKLKRWEDDEFQIINIVAAETGREEGAAIFVCQSKGSARSFRVRPAMSLTHRRDIYRHRGEYKDWWTKVKFEGYSTDGVPLKPIAEGLFSNPKQAQ